MPLLMRRPDEHLRAVESVLSQDFAGPLELLIVDDGSDPAVPAFPDERVRILRLPRNYGISHALNAGLTQARYEWIARVDGDDYWYPGKLAKQWALLRAHPDLTLVGTSLRLVHPANPKLDRDELRGGDWAKVLALTQRIGCPFAHSSVLGRRDVFELLGGYPQAARFQHAEDYALWAQWIRFFPVAICDEILVDYTISEGRISSLYEVEQLRASELVYRVLGQPGDLPGALHQLAAGMRTTVFDTSKALFRAWRYYEYILADNELFHAAATMLPDRAVFRTEEAEKLLADRFYRLKA